MITSLASLLFITMFLLQKFTTLDFWWMMSGNIGLLLILVNIFDPNWKTEIIDDLKKRLFFKLGIGLLSALFLYGVFYIGNTASRFLFSFAGENIDNVYAFKSGAAPLRIILLMLLLIGPGEELFWRGFVQRNFQKDVTPWKGFLLASAIYTLVHMASGNVMLVLAAGVCGFFWGYLYYRLKSIWLNILSHTLWDVAIFIIFPMN